ncbi:hypothetical protein BJ742DRAFT_807936 [Cladochytrium replicatum]|nr:hypothetical protein BJ742DRAFT_807936 [Cladochytrium replicatum]
MVHKCTTYFPIFHRSCAIRSFSAGFIASIILNRPLFTAPSLDATPGPATYLLGIAVPMHLMVALLFWRDHILMMRALQAVEDEEGRAVMASTVTQRRQRRRTNSCGSEGDEESECTLVDDDPYPAIPVRAITTPASRALR